MKALRPSVLRHRLVLHPDAELENVSADELVAREHQLESNQQVSFVRDAGRMMTTETLGLSRFDNALNASLMLGQVAAKTDDEVGPLCFAECVLALRAHEAPGTVLT